MTTHELKTKQDYMAAYYHMVDCHTIQKSTIENLNKESAEWRAKLKDCEAKLKEVDAAILELKRLTELEVGTHKEAIKLLLILLNTWRPK